MNRNKTRLRRYLELNKIPLVLAFLGEDGSGRKATAYWFAKEAGVKPQYLEVHGADKKLTVSEARSIINRRVVVPTKRLRFIIIEDFNRASRSAWNALLKITESPPERTHFLLVGDSKGLPSTMHSRSVCLYFGGLENSDLITEVEQDPRCKLVWDKLNNQDKELFLKVSEGSWGKLKGILGNDSVRKLMLSIVHNFTVPKVKPEFFRAVRDYTALDDAFPLANVFRILFEDDKSVYSKRMFRNLNIDLDEAHRVLNMVGILKYQRNKIFEYLYMVTR